MLTGTARRDERGFTMVEMVIASAMIAALIAIFMVFFGQSTSTHQKLGYIRTAERVLASEMETLAAVTFDNLILAPDTGDYQDCVFLSGVRRSTRAVDPAPQTRTVDGLPITISRTVTWQHSGETVSATTGEDGVVTCDEKAQPKLVTVTVTWNDGQRDQERVATVVRSRWAESLDPASGPASSLVEAGRADMHTVDAWCPSGPHTVTSTDGIAVITLADLTACGATITGLTAGATYTAVMTVSVPPTSPPIEIEADTIGRGSIVASATNTWQTISITWQQTDGTTRTIGPAIAAGNAHIPDSQVRVSSLVVYKN